MALTKWQFTPVELSYTPCGKALSVCLCGAPQLNSASRLETLTFKKWLRSAPVAYCQHNVVLSKCPTLASSHCVKLEQSMEFHSATWSQELMKNAFWNALFWPCLFLNYLNISLTISLSVYISVAVNLKSTVFIARCCIQTSKQMHIYKCHTPNIQCVMCFNWIYDQIISRVEESPRWNYLNYTLLWVNDVIKLLLSNQFHILCP